MYMPKPMLVPYFFSLCPCAVDHPPATTSRPTPVAKTTAGSGAIQAIASASASSVSTAAAKPSVPADPSVTVGHIRVSIKKVSVGKVPLKSVDGTITYPDEPRLMVALHIENISDKKQSGYNTWVPDLEAARTFAKLTVDGKELKRVTFGFGNNVKGRTVLDTLTPGKVISDLLVFEAPPAGARSFLLELPGANCGVKGAFNFKIDAASVRR